MRFVLVGGVALQLHGFSGATRDVDVTIALDPDNEHRVTAALEALQARPFMTGDRGSAFHTRLGGLEIMRNTDGVGDYEAWSRHADQILHSFSSFAGQALTEVQVGRPSDLLPLEKKRPRARQGEHPSRPSPRASSRRLELLANGALDPSECVRGAVAELRQPPPPLPEICPLSPPPTCSARARGETRPRHLDAPRS